MMEHPEYYRKSLENKNIEYLIKERNCLIKSMESFENDEIPEMDYYSDPDAATEYMFDYLYLIEICNLISERISNKFKKNEDIITFDNLKEE